MARPWAPDWSPKPAHVQPMGRPHSTAHGLCRGLAMPRVHPKMVFEYPPIFLLGEEDTVECKIVLIFCFRQTALSA